MSQSLPLEEVYIFLLERAARRIKKYGKDQFKALGINLSSEQWVVLKRIHECPGTNQRDLAAMTYKDPASITRILDLLQQRGYIERIQETDRRSHDVQLTPEGGRIVQKVLPLAVAVRAKGLDGFSETEKQQLKTLLKRIYHNFDD